MAALKFFLQSYFSELNYLLVYLHKGLHKVANAAVYTFTGAYFLKQGMPLHYVLLFFGLEFGLRGFMCPYGIALINRIGIVPSLSISVLFYILFFIIIACSQGLLWLCFLSFIFHALGSGIYYPLYDITEAIFVKDHNRGRQYAFGMINEAIMSMVGVALFGYLLTNYSYSFAVLPLIGFWFLSILPYFILQKEIKRIPSFKPHDVYPFLASEFRPYLTPLFGFQLVIIAKAVAAPLFIYSIVGEMDMLGLLVAATIAVELFITLCFGHYLDKKGTSHALRPSVGFNWLCMIGFITMAKTPLTVFLSESLHKISYNLLQSSIVTGLHKKFKNGQAHLLIYGAGMQMTLCFFELLILPIYALLAFTFGANVYYLIFLGSMIGAYISAYYFWKEKNRGNLIDTPPLTLEKNMASETGTGDR